MDDLITADPLDLEPIRTRAAEASPGPWEYAFSGDDDYGSGLFPSVLTVSHGDVVIRFDTGDRALNEASSTWKNDADFIANSRDDIPALVAEVERLRAILATAAHDAWERGHSAGEFNTINQSMSLGHELILNPHPKPKTEEANRG